MNKAIKFYLACYNLAAFCFWLAYIICFACTNFILSPGALILLDIAQGMAVLEIVHAAMKWVKSPVLSTAAQIFSRVLVVVLINLFVKGIYGSVTPLAQAGIAIVSIAWVVTELVRYAFYFLSLFGMQPYGLLWMRYSFFIILYPLGVTGEWFIIISPLMASHFAFSPYMALVIFLFCAYAYYFPVLYKYMWKQRRARINTTPLD